MAVPSIIALQSASPNMGLSGLLSVTNVMLAPLVGALVYMLKAFADACKAGNKSLCTKKECKREQILQGRFKIGILAAIIVVIILTIGWCVTFSITEEERGKLENDLRSRISAELLHKVRAEIGIANSIAVLDRVKSGLSAERDLLMSQMKDKSPTYQNREFLRGSLLNLIAILSQQADYCRIAEEMVGREEPENIAGVLFKMQRELVLILYPEYYKEEAAKAALSPGEALPEMPVITADDIWKRRQEAVNTIENTYFPEIERLRAALLAKSAPASKPTLENTEKVN